MAAEPADITDADRARAALSRATAALRDDLDADALAACRQALALETPLAGAAHHLLGILHARRGAWPDAIVAFEDAVDREPDNVAYRQALASALTQAGRLDEADTAYRSLLDLAPEDERARLGLADLHLKRGRNTEAIDVLRPLTASRPDTTIAWVRLGDACARIGDWPQAARALDRALAAAPEDKAALSLRGQAAMELADWTGAIDLFERLLQQAPGHARTHAHLGVCFRRHGDRDTAERHFRAAVEGDPGLVHAWRGLIALLVDAEDARGACTVAENALRHHPDDAHLWTQIGWCREQDDDHEAAADAYRRALEHEPDSAVAHYNLGVALGRLGDRGGAEAAYERALSIDPAFAPALHNLGLLRQEGDDQAGAIDAFEAALRADPNHHLARLNLAHALRVVGRIPAALDHVDRLIARDPSDARAHFVRSMCLLSQGRLTEGWVEYEWRYQDPDIRRLAGYHDFRRPRWEGQELSGETVLVFTEQGYGDAFQFARYLPAVKARDARVVVECRQRVAALLKAMPAVDEVVIAEKGVDPDIEYDFYIPMMSLPGLFGTTIESIPAEIPYLRADTDLVADWRVRLAGEGLKVGLVWAGNVKHQHDHLRSIDLGAFAPLGRVEGVRFFSLQVGRRGDDAAPDGLDIEPVAPALRDFSDTAAALEVLDLLITVDTAPAHLAGALGRPTWILLQQVPDWRWFVDREDSPWYPTARLFRQSRDDDWDAVIARVARELETAVGRTATP